MLLFYTPLKKKKKKKDKNTKRRQQCRSHIFIFGFEPISKNFLVLLLIALNMFFQLRQLILIIAGTDTW